MKGERLGEFEELVLLAVRGLGEEAHGPAVQELLERSTDRSVTLGSIYTALDRAQRKGFAESWLGEPTGERGGRAKRHYALTEDGLDALRASRATRDRLWDATREATT